MYKYIRQKAFEYPFAAWGSIFGLAGPVAVFSVPPICERIGYKKIEPIPKSYPVPNRPRQPTEGYED
ncbi:hypothetical protein BB559_003115 [Furculomyces boomerangus]|uniref:NADH-ubiquinone oxidoreductase 9.5 kDa subunit n=2 Tax=Harpellales TaxID=61421 RepID=A0A2T9YNL3_9FUNG|nr:hypothetical protein BB559_003115 [Furculomyces boomerangus]PWA00104.1 hypothetical protein BB558_003858 [Smittium angustum]